MKKILAATLLFIFAVVFVPCAVFAQQLKISGEAKTGLYWESIQQDGGEVKDDVKLHNKDDAGQGQGRFRLNLDYDNGNNFGMRSRLDWEKWGGNEVPDWKYGFGYGHFFEDQLTVSVGKLGGSPWGTGGPEMWKELEENSKGGGMRVEYKPSFIPVGHLNVGFVLNYFNADMDQGTSNIKITLAEILRESVIGVSYTHDWGLIRFAYRFDSDADAIQDNKFLEDGGKGEDEIVYRIEERKLTDFLPGFQIWALGHLFGLSAVNPDVRWFRNWVFAQYEPEELGSFTKPFTAQLRFGHLYIENRSEMLIKPSFYWNFLNKLFSVGLAFTYNQDFGNKLTEGSPYQYIEFEPKAQINFSSSYIAFVYSFRKEYIHEFNALPGREPIKQTQWMNLRFCIYY